MGRQLRIEYAGALYHVMARGNGKQWIYNNDYTLNLFIETLRAVVKKFQVKIHAFVLMRNHYHLLIETPFLNLSLGMKKFNQDYARKYNNFRNRRGSVFRDRYKAILIQKENYYYNVLRYISQNPVRAGIVSKCEDYPGGSIYYLNSNRKNLEDVLFLDDIILNFNIKDKDFKGFIRWTNEIEEPKLKDSEKYKYLLGSTDWMSKIAKNLPVIQNGIKSRKKLYSIKFNKGKLHGLLKKSDYPYYKEILLYFYSKYSSLKMTEIIKRANVKSAPAGWQRLYRFKKRLEKESPIKKQIEDIEKIVL